MPFTFYLLPSWLPCLYYTSAACTTCLLYHILPPLSEGRTASTNFCPSFSLCSLPSAYLQGEKISAFTVYIAIYAARNASTSLPHRRRQQPFTISLERGCAFTRKRRSILLPRGILSPFAPRRCACRNGISLRVVRGGRAALRRAGRQNGHLRSLPEPCRVCRHAVCIKT